MSMIATNYDKLAPDAQRRAAYDFLQCEGCHDGEEYETIDTWYDAVHSPRFRASEAEREIRACEDGKFTGAMPPDAF